MGVTALSGLESFNEIINNGNFIIIDFWATWCGPCRLMSPIFEQLSEHISGPEFYKVDVDEEQAIAEEIGIRSMPTFTVFKDGQKVDELVGADPGKLEMLVRQFDM